MIDWIQGEDFPDFERIRSTQSFNWSAFSIPLWARFTNMKEYKAGYGIIGYNVNTIRRTKMINSKFENDTFKLVHRPIENNYSHCELVQLKEVAKKDKRELRMTFKHNCIRPVFPLKERSKIKIFNDYLRMYFHRSILTISSVKKHSDLDPKI